MKSRVSPEAGEETRKGGQTDAFKRRTSDRTVDMVVFRGSRLRRRGKDGLEAMLVSPLYPPLLHGTACCLSFFLLSLPVLSLIAKYIFPLLPFRKSRCKERTQLGAPTLLENGATAGRTFSPYPITKTYITTSWLYFERREGKHRYPDGDVPAETQSLEKALPSHENNWQRPHRANVKNRLRTMAGTLKGAKESDKPIFRGSL